MTKSLHRLRFGAAALLSLSALSTAPQVYAWGLPKAPKVPKIETPKVPNAKDLSSKEKDALRELESLTKEGKIALQLRFQEDKYELLASNMERITKNIYTPAEEHRKSILNPLADSKGIIKKWEEVASSYQDALQQLEVAKLYAPIRENHRQSFPVSEADLGAFAQGVKAYTAKADKAASKHVDSWKKTLSQTEKNNAELAKHKSANDARQLSRTNEEKRATLHQNYAANFKAMKQALETKPGPLPSELWARYDELLKEADSLTPEIRTAYEFDMLGYRIHDALHSSNMSEAVGALLGGAKVAATGTGKVGENKLSLKAEAGQCYFLAGKFQEPIANQSHDFVVHAGKLEVHTIRFQLAGGRSTPDLNIWGVCTGKAATFPWTLKVNSPASNSVFEWAAFSIPRDSLSVELVAQMAQLTHDDCVSEVHKYAWKNALPGRLVYTTEGTPLLFRRNTGLELKSMGLVPGMNASLEQLSSEVPDSPNIPATDTYCTPTAASIDPTVVANVKCTQKLKEESAAKRSRLEAQMSNPSSFGQYNSAKAQLAKVSDEYSRKYDAQCAPLEKKYTANVAKTLQELKDWFLTKPTPSTTLNVVDYLKTVAKGFK